MMGFNGWHITYSCWEKKKKLFENAQAIENSHTKETTTTATTTPTSMVKWNEDDLSSCSAFLGSWIKATKTKRSFHIRIHIRVYWTREPVCRYYHLWLKQLHSIFISMQCKRLYISLQSHVISCIECRAALFATAITYAYIDIYL